MPTTTETADIIKLSQLVGAPRSGSAADYTTVPEGTELHDLETFHETPRRIVAAPCFSELASFIRYTNDFKGDPTRIFAKTAIGANSFTAVFDYHAGPGAPEWCDHRAVYACPPSVEWLVWIANSSMHMKQWEFATFLRNNLADIVEPTGAEMLEIALTLQAKKSVDFSSSLRLGTGDQQLKYVETTDAKAGQSGTMEIPESFALGLPPFTGGTVYRVEARLNHRITEGKLTLWYEIVRPHKVIEAAIHEMTETITKETTIAPLAGTI